jgi:hypothetical protein
VQASRDPFHDAGECKIGDTHDETIVQLAKNGRNLLLRNSSCFVFVLGVYAHNARIYRFDRSPLKGLQLYPFSPSSGKLSLAARTPREIEFRYHRVGHHHHTTD